MSVLRVREGWVGRKIIFVIIINVNTIYIHDNVINTDKYFLVKHSIFMVFEYIYSCSLILEQN